MPKLLFAPAVLVYLLLSFAAPAQEPVFAPESQRAIAALKQQAESGDARAEVELGVAYASGDGVPVDAQEAVRWFQKAADQGDAAGEYSLSEMFLTGRGVNADFTQGLKWLRKSAEHGDPRGQFNLAAIYEQGQGVPKDETEAAKWARRAADQGLAAGQFALGSMYAHGTGVPQSEAEAAVWYRRAADQGDAPSMNNLAVLLSTSSDGKLRNPNEAVSFALKAVATETDNPAYLDTLATAYYGAGQPDKAAEAERRALVLNPEKASYKQALEKYEAAGAKH
jgi:TPR repeat protein